MSDELWYEYLKKVKPLRDSKLSSPKLPQEKAPEKVSIDALDYKAHIPFMPLPKINIHKLKELEISEGEGIDKRLRKKMDSGVIKLDGVLDLHGYTRETAYQLLKRFIATAHEQGKRMLLVITGKGYKSEDNVSVLRRELPHWLNDAEIRDKIIRFSLAKPKHGGSGAFYILLKRARGKS